MVEILEGYYIFIRIDAYGETYASIPLLGWPKSNRSYPLMMI